MDTEFARLSIDARCVWFDSLFYLAAIGEPGGFFPHTELVREMGRQADRVASELLNVQCWTLCALGYVVNAHSGCRVLPEERAAIPDRVRQSVYRRDGYRCVTCGTTERLSLDHIHPWSLGGSDEPSNLQTMCIPCNSRKGARV